MFDLSGGNVMARLQPLAGAAGVPLPIPPAGYTVDAATWARRWWAGRCSAGGPTRDITRFSPRIDRIFPGEALNPFFGALDEGFLEFRSRLLHS